MVKTIGMECPREKKRKGFAVNNLERQDSQCMRVDLAAGYWWPFEFDCALTVGFVGHRRLDKGDSDHS